ncbi:MAG: hypothetical protein ACP5UV_01140 [Thermoplasmata archaeon]
MNDLFALFFSITSIFLALLMVEVMGSFQLIFWWKKSSKNVLPFVIPIWELTGTFLAFWVVVADFAFPNVLVPAAYIYAVPLLLLLIFFIGRNAFIVFGEFVKKGLFSDRTLYTIFSAFEILFVLVFLVFASSLVSGAGVDISKLQFIASKWFSVPGDWLFVISAVLVVIGLSFVFYGLENYRLYAFIFTYLGIILTVVTVLLIHSSVPAVTFNGVLAIPLIIGVLLPILFYIDSTKKIVETKVLFIAILAIAVFPFYSLVYPNVFGASVPVSIFITNTPMSIAFYYITLGGGIILLLMLSYMSYIANLAKKNAEKSKTNA